MEYCIIFAQIIITKTKIMNKITKEQFKQKQAEMTDKELHDLVRTELSKLCKTGGKSLTMCVPPMVTDTDMLISELLNRFKRLTNCG
jgi:hypothetical protein